jgi:hypothetical protein
MISVLIQTLVVLTRVPSALPERGDLGGQRAVLWPDQVGVSLKHALRCGAGIFQRA